MTLEVRVDLMRHVGPDAFDAEQVLLGRGAQALDGTELRGQHLRRRLAHLRDAERVKEAAERRMLAVLESRNEVLSRLVREALELDHLLPGQSVEVAGVLDPSLLDDLVERGVAEALDVESTTAGEMAQELESLRATERVDASVRDVWLLADDLPPTHRALGGHAPAFLRLLDADDLRDDVARAMDDHARAHVDAFLIYLRLVVHRDVAHRDASDDHRLDVRDRRQHAGAADVAVDCLHVRLGLLGRVLESHRPAR